MEVIAKKKIFIPRRCMLPSTNSLARVDNSLFPLHQGVQVACVNQESQRHAMRTYSLLPVGVQYRYTNQPHRVLSRITSTLIDYQHTHTQLTTGTYTVTALSNLASGSANVDGAKSAPLASSTDRTSTVTLACPPNPYVGTNLTRPAAKWALITVC